jgi:hypothetical protein
MSPIPKRWTHRFSLYALTLRSFVYGQSPETPPETNLA